LQRKIDTDFLDGSYAYEAFEERKKLYRWQRDNAESKSKFKLESRFFADEQDPLYESRLADRKEIRDKLEGAMQEVEPLKKAFKEMVGREEKKLDQHPRVGGKKKQSSLKNLQDKWDDLSSVQKGLTIGGSAVFVAGGVALIYYLYNKYWKKEKTLPEQKIQKWVALLTQAKANGEQQYQAALAKLHAAVDAEQAQSIIKLFETPQSFDWQGEAILPK